VPLTSSQSFTLFSSQDLFGHAVQKSPIRAHSSSASHTPTIVRKAEFFVSRIEKRRKEKEERKEEEEEEDSQSKQKRSPLPNVAQPSAPTPNSPEKQNLTKTMATSKESVIKLTQDDESALGESKLLAENRIEDPVRLAKDLLHSYLLLYILLHHYYSPCIFY
jgi:hypothetical protein